MNAGYAVVVVARTGVLRSSVSFVASASSSAALAGSVGPSDEPRRRIMFLLARDFECGVTTLQARFCGASLSRMGDAVRVVRGEDDEEEEVEEEEEEASATTTKRSPPRRKLAPSLPSSALISAIQTKLRRTSRALIAALAKGREKAETMFDAVANSVEETRVAVEDAKVGKREIERNLNAMTMG